MKKKLKKIKIKKIVESMKTGSVAEGIGKFRLEGIKRRHRFVRLLGVVIASGSVVENVYKSDEHETLRNSAPSTTLGRG